jgi:large-conductance mechanosensitive channel|tara:strand:+ start:2905 stop:3018 length:114 start_codon:yes stop_codon:yes gene_type:complete
VKKFIAAFDEKEEEQPDEPSEAIKLLTEIRDTLKYIL